MSREPPTAASMTRIQVCGPLRAERAGARIDGRLPGRQGRLLYAYLVLNRHRSVPRAELADALWPLGFPPNADSGLSALLSKMRQILGPAAIEGRGSLRLLEDDAWVDLEAAREAVHRAESSIVSNDYRRAWAPSQIALFAAERGLLVGEEGDAAFGWITDERHRLEDLRLRALEVYGTACLGVGGTELAGAVRAARALVEAAPFRESGYRILMRGLAAQGNRAEALQIYTQLRGTLRDELGVSPSPATVHLFTEINA